MGARARKGEWESWFIPKSCCRRSFRDLLCMGCIDAKTEKQWAKGEGWVRDGRVRGASRGEWGYTIIMASCKISQVSRCEMTFVWPFKFFSFSLYIFSFVCVFLFISTRQNTDCRYGYFQAYNVQSVLQQQQQHTFKGNEMLSECKKKKGI